MRLVPLISLCGLALARDVLIVNRFENFKGSLRTLGELEDLKSQLDKQLKEAKTLFDKFNSEKNAEKAKSIKKKLDKVEAAARQTQRKIRAAEKKDNSSAATDDKSGLGLKDQVKDRAEARDADGNSEALELANEDLKTGGSTAGDKAKKAVDGSVLGVKKAGTKVKHEIKDAGEAMADEAIKAGDKVKAGAVAVGNAAVNASLGIKNAAKHAGTNSQIAAQNAGDAIGDKATEIKDNVAGGMKNLGGHIKKGGEHVVEGVKTAGDAVHVAAVNTGDWLGDSATNLRNSITGGLASGFGALGQSMKHLGADMGTVVVRPLDLGLKWWQALLAVLGTTALVGLFASIWELTGLGKKHAYEIDEIKPHFVNPPAEAVDASKPVDATAAATTVTVSEQAPPTVLPATSIEHTEVTTAPVVTGPTIIEQATPAVEAEMVTVESEPMKPSTITISQEADGSPKNINLLREKFNRQD